MVVGQVFVVLIWMMEMILHSARDLPTSRPYGCLQLLQRIDAGRCGGLPFFYNTQSKQFICGATDPHNLLKWGTGLPCRSGDSIWASFTKLLHFNEAVVTSCA